MLNSKEEEKPMKGLVFKAVRMKRYSHSRILNEDEKEVGQMKVSKTRDF